MTEWRHFYFAVGKCRNTSAIRVCSLQQPMLPLDVCLIYDSLRCAWTCLLLAFLLLFASLLLLASLMMLLFHTNISHIWLSRTYNIYVIDNMQNWSMILISVYRTVSSALPTPKEYKGRGMKFTKTRGCNTQKKILYLYVFIRFIRLVVKLFAQL